MKKRHKHAFSIGAVLIVISLVLVVVSTVTPEISPVINEQFVNKTAEELILQTHELPKYRPPLHWNRMLKSPAGEDGLQGLTSGVMAVYGRRQVDNRTNNIFIIEQVTHRVLVFDSFENAAAYHQTRLTTLENSQSDIVFDKLGSTSRCKGFYNRTSALDTMVTPCIHGNVYFEVKASSREFSVKNRTQVTISVTEGKLV